MSNILSQQVSSGSWLKENEVVKTHEKQLKLLMPYSKLRSPFQLATGLRLPSSGQPCLKGLQRCKLQKCDYSIAAANNVPWLHGLMPLVTFVIQLPPPALSVQQSLVMRAKAVKQKEGQRLICLICSCSSR